MENLTQNESLKIKDFFKTLASTIAKIIYDSLDKDVYKTVTINVNEITGIKNFSDYKQNNLFYVTDFAKENIQGKTGLLLPEELVADIADVLTGGSGENSYTGTLSELQVNSVKDLIKNSYKETEKFFKETYDKNLAFSNSPKIL